jgi:CRP/FNR family transcriptional regulator, cyclic AMP receptor protein
MALLGQGLAGSYAEAMMPCVLCLMSREDVKTLLGDPRIALRIAEILGQRLIEAERRLSDFAFMNLPERRAALLLRLVQEARPRLWGGGHPEVRYTREQPAEMIGTYRETATKILNEFRAAGWVDLRCGKTVILNRAALARLADS